MEDPLSRSHTAPKFAAPDPGAIANWYVEHLGFPRKAVFEAGAYAIVGRGDLTLHLWKCPDRHIAENTACYTELRDTDVLNALHSELLARSKKDGFAPGRVEAVPKDQNAHSMREFHVWDPAGNLIGFGAALS
ncbi:VOC family protein [Hyphomonas sp.]|uniref:VOC family protein n=1 Tax=Hyphomonas sp. TaxID=87 RepID=UPI003D2999E7